MKKFLALIDGSGSMNPSRLQTISALNSYIKDLSEVDDLDCTVIVWSSRRYDTLYSGPVKKAPIFIQSDYVCKDLTPLVDSVAKGLLDFLWTPADKKYFLVMTDGLENDSTEYTMQQVNGFMQDFRNQGGKLDFIGCDIDAWSVGNLVGYLKHETHSFVRGDEASVYKGSSSRSYNYFTENKTDNSADGKVFGSED